MGTAAQRNNHQNLQREKVVKLESKARNKRRPNHTIEDMRNQDSVTVCAVPIPVEDASVLVDALAQNAAERRIDMSQAMVYPMNNSKHFSSTCFFKGSPIVFFLYLSANIIREF